jgi:hypothetical protein
MDDDLAIHFIKAGDRANFHAIGKFAFVTFVGYDMRHIGVFLLVEFKSGGNFPLAGENLQPDFSRGHGGREHAGQPAIGRCFLAEVV